MSVFGYDEEAIYQDADIDAINAELVGDDLPIDQPRCPVPNCARYATHKGLCEPHRARELRDMALATLDSRRMT